MVDYLNFYRYFSFEDFIVVFLLYNFFKFLILSAINELTWPTQFFNRRHSFSYTFLKFRTYTETLLKLKNYNLFFFVFNIFFIKKKYLNKV